jgi:hypothetical protein
MSHTTPLWATAGSLTAGSLSLQAHAHDVKHCARMGLTCRVLNTVQADRHDCMHQLICEALQKGRSLYTRNSNPGIPRHLLRAARKPQLGGR